MQKVNFSTKNLDESLPSGIMSLLQEFKDMFPEEILSGLPPIQIDFILGAILPNHLAYRTNLEEIKEI